MRTLGTSTTAKLFATGFTVGPIVDSLHNQCLLRYGVLPINLEWPVPFLRENENALVDIAIGGSGGNAVDNYPYFFCSSWTVPPLLGFAYVVLGLIFPRIVEATLESLSNQKLQEQASTTTTTSLVVDESSLSPPSFSPSSSPQLRTRALLAVTTTAMIIKLSEFLETHPGLFDGFEVFHKHPESAFVSLMVMISAALIQWAVLDGSIVALLVASVTAIGGPLAELPFVGHGVWTYLEGAGDYLPLQNVFPGVAATASTATGEGHDLLLQIAAVLFGTTDYQDLALSSITGPCYFAVAMDAIALGRWFDASKNDSSPVPSIISQNTKK